MDRYLSGCAACMNDFHWQRPAIILNRQSGTISGLGPEAVATELREIFAASGATAEVFLVDGAEVQKALEKALASPADAIIIGGGDGTVATAATVLAGKQKPLGILPLGTFNLAARDVGMPLDWREAARLLATAQVGEMDLLEVGGGLYCCVVVLGFYPALAMGKKEYHGNWLVKTARVTIEALRSVATFPPLDMVMRNREGQEVRRRSRIALVANNDYEDIFGMIPKRSSLDGGFFTIYVSTHRTRWGLMRSLLKWLVGRWKQDRELTILHTTEVEINVRGRRRVAVMRDGELDKIPVPIRIKLLPKALRVLLPPPPSDEPVHTLG